MTVELVGSRDEEQAQAHALEDSSDALPPESFSDDLIPIVTPIPEIQPEHLIDDEVEIPPIQYSRETVESQFSWIDSLLKTERVIGYADLVNQLQAEMQISVTLAEKLIDHARQAKRLRFSSLQDFEIYLTN